MGSTFSSAATLAFFVVGLGIRRISFLFVSIGILSLLLSTPRAAVKYDKDLSQFGEVSSEPYYGTPGEVFFEFTTLNEVTYSCKAIDLPWRNASKITHGAKLSIRGSFNSLSKSKNPFSYENKLLRRGISGKCTVKFVEIPREVSPPYWSKFRSNAEAFLIDALGDNETTGLMISMALGIPVGISEQTERDFRSLGLLHILVISGFQVSILFGFFKLIFNFLPFFLNRFSDILSLSLVTLYVEICGSEHAAVRALVALMLIIVTARTSGRKSLLNSIFTSLFVVSLIWPGSIFDLGTELTYGALFGLALGSEAAKKRGKVLQALSAAIVASMITGLLCIIWGKVSSPLGLFLNPIFPPLLSWLAGPILGVASLLKFLSDDLGNFLLQCISVVFGFMISIITGLAPFGDSLNTLTIRIIQIVCYAIVLVCVVCRVVLHWIQFVGLKGSAIRGEG